MVQWTTRLENRSITGEDHLGIESPAQAYQGYLLTGVITTTSRVRYFSFYAWVLHRFLQTHSHDLSLDAFKVFICRYELTFILGCYYHHRIKQENILTGLIGGGNNNSTAHNIWTNTDHYIDLDTKYLSAELGGLGQPYGTVVQRMSVMHERKRGQIPTLTTNIGLRLAEAFEQTVEGTKFHTIVSSDDPAPAEISKDVIEDFGVRVCLCPDSLAHGADMEPLREMLFRFDLEHDLNNLYVARRLSLGMLLDFARAANSYDVMSDDVMRRVIYLGVYDVEHAYDAHPALEDWYFRWRMVMIRQMYTNGLQCLFRAFTDWVNDRERLEQATFENWMTRLQGQPILQDILHMSLDDYLTMLCQEVGADDWRSGDFVDKCTLNTNLDEITLFDDIATYKAEFLTTEVLVHRGLRIICQVVLRCLVYQEHALWSDLRAKSGTLRLPMDRFISRLVSDTESGETVGTFLKMMFREYIIGQHEIVALDKLRYQQDNTFRFTYSDGIFYSEDLDYGQPLRYPSLRLYNALQMLIDVGFVVYNDDGGSVITPDGQAYLDHTIGMVS